MKFSIVNIGTNTGATGATLAITVGAAGVPVGSTIFVLVTEKSTAGISGTLADTAGNSYATITAGNLNAAAASGRGTLFAVTNCKALVNTNTITYTRNLSAASCAISAFYVSGVTGAATFTEGVATATGSTGTITVTSGSLGAGRLVLGALFDSGTSVAGGNATFTNAASFATPPNEANTTGSGGSRVNGGVLFKAASGTQVYNPTLSSTAQVWFLAALGIIPAPDVADSLDEPDQPNRPAKPFDPPNLLLNTLNWPPLGPTIDFTLEQVARKPSPAAPTDFPNLLLTTLAPPAVVVNYTFRSPIFVKIPILPKAGGEVAGTLNALLTPNPSQPFAQFDWPRSVDGKQIIKQEYAANLLPFQSMAPTGVPPPPTVDQPVGGVRPKAIVDPVGPAAALLTPNPPQPFIQSDWLRQPSLPKAIGEVVGILSPLLTPNPTRPFNQYEWRTTARVPSSLKSDVYWGTFAIYSPNPAQPFSQSDWPRAVDARAKAVGEPIGVMPPAMQTALPFALSDWPSIRTTQVAKPTDQQNLLTSTLAPPVVVVNYVYRTPIFARLPDPWPKAKVDDPFNLTIYLPTVVVAVAFKQLDWPLPARPPAKQADTSAAASAPLYTPNPAQPFSQTDWTRIFTTSKAKVDDFVNLLPVQTVVVTFAPFFQSDWAAIIRAATSQKSDVYAAPNPLLTPNPSLPFNQDLWEAAARAFPKVVGEAVGTLSPILTPNPRQPFSQNIWDSAAPAKAKAYADPFAASAPLYTPNPSRPFAQGDWPSATIVLKPAKVDTVNLLLPVYAPNPTQPFVNPTETRTFAVQIVKSDIIINTLPLVTPPPVVNPFVQGDWPSTATVARSDRSFSAGINLPLITPPTPPSVELHQNPFFTTMGRLSQLGNLPS